MMGTEASLFIMHVMVSSITTDNEVIRYEVVYSSTVVYEACYVYEYYHSSNLHVIIDPGVYTLILVFALSVT